MIGSKKISCCKLCGVERKEHEVWEAFNVSDYGLCLTCWKREARGEKKGMREPIRISFGDGKEIKEFIEEVEKLKSENGDINIQLAYEELPEHKEGWIIEARERVSCKCCDAIDTKIVKTKVLSCVS